MHHFRIAAIGASLALTLGACSPPQQSDSSDDQRREAAELVRQALRESYKAAYELQWPTALRKVEWVLMVDPGFGLARELKARLQEWSHLPPPNPTLIFQLEQWARTTEEAFPYEPTLQPSLNSTLDFLGDHPDAPAPHGPKGVTGGDDEKNYQDYSCDADLFRAMETIKITLTGGTTLTFLIDGVRELTGLNIHLDQAAIRLLAADCAVDCTDETVAEVFDRLLGPLQLTYRVKYGVVILACK